MYANPEQLARCVKDYGSTGRWLCASSNVHSDEVNGSIVKVNGNAVNKTKLITCTAGKDNKIRSGISTQVLC